MKAIIFGANGQDGYYLNELCNQEGIDVVGVSRTGHWINGDVSCFELVEQMVVKHKPAYVFHIAANSTTRHDALFENHQTISTGTLNILEAVKRHCPDAKVFITGSGVQFKNSGNPISENSEFEGNSPYSLARINSVYAARYYRTLGIQSYVGYLFHHESPYRKPFHVSQMVAKAVKRIASGSEEIIEIGDITVKKEWTFAGDVAKGIFTLLAQNDIFEATIGSGNAFSIEDWVNSCFLCVGKDWRNHVRVKENFKPEYKCLVSDPSTINSLGWYPSVDMQKLASMMVSCL